MIEYGGTDFVTCNNLFVCVVGLVMVIGSQAMLLLPSLVFSCRILKGFSSLYEKKNKPKCDPQTDLKKEGVLREVVGYRDVVVPG